MQRLQEACGSRLQSYFHVAAHLPICSFFPRRKHGPHGCLPTAASLAGTRGNDDDCISPVCLRGWITLGGGSRSDVDTVNVCRSFPYFSSTHLHCCGGEIHTPAVHRSVSYRHLRHARLEILLLPEPAVMLDTAQLSAAAWKWIIPHLSSSLLPTSNPHSLLICDITDADSGSLFSHFPRVTPCLEPLRFAF